MTDSFLGRRLYRREELPFILDLRSEQVAQLERTGQLTAIRICGEDRFAAREIEALIETYHQITKRRKSTNAN